MLPSRRLIGYRSRKCAQVAALFTRAAGDRIEKLKLIKLLYLVERENVATFGLPMFFDEYYSLRHGPICSNSLDAINGRLDVEVWRDYILQENNREIRLARVSEDEQFDELSDADIEVIRAVWRRFGDMTAMQIRRWTHRHCTEYVEVEDGALPITAIELASAVGEAEPEAVEHRIAMYRHISAAHPPPRRHAEPQRNG